MAVIVPTIMTNSPEKYKALIGTLHPFAKRVQIDICDGQFVPTTTIPEINAWWPKEWEVDFHMMVVNPKEHLQNILKLKPSLCLFHAETGENLLPIISELKAHGIKAGIALVKHTYPGNVKAMIEASDHVLIFGGEIGKQGSQADLLQAEKVKLIREIKHTVEIGWDGGASIQNVRALAQAGIDVSNVGSAISQSKNPEAVFKALEAETEKWGVRL